MKIKTANTSLSRLNKNLLINSLCFFLSFGASSSLLADSAVTSLGSLEQRSQELESEIEMRKRQAENGDSEDAKQYQQGFRDGYNKAILDLVKAKLMPSDPNAAKGLAGLGGTPDVSPSTPENNSELALLINQSVDSLHNKQWDAAIVAANQAISKDPRHIAPYINRAWANAEKGHIQRAIADANQAILINPENALAYNNRAYATELAGQVIEAKVDYQRACNYGYQPACGTSLIIAKMKATDIAAQVAMLMSQSLDKFEDKDWQAVENITTRILNLDPQNVAAYANRSGARVELGKFDNALHDSTKAIKLNPKYGIAHNNLGYAYERMGKRAMAVSSYEAACDLGVQQSCFDKRRLENIE